MNPDAPVLPPPATPPRPRLKRSALPVGQHIESPKRRRPWRRDSQLVVRPGLALEAEQLRAEIAEIRHLYDTHDHEGTPQPTGSEGAGLTNDIPSYDDATDDMNDNTYDDVHVESSPALHVVKDSYPHRLLPDEASYKLYSNWLVLIPTLVPEYLGYMEHAQGRLGRSSSSTETKHCRSGAECVPKASEIQCLHFDCTCFRLGILLI